MNKDKSHSLKILNKGQVRRIVDNARYFPRLVFPSADHPFFNDSVGRKHFAQNTDNIHQLLLNYQYQIQPKPKYRYHEYIPTQNAEVQYNFDLVRKKINRKQPLEELEKLTRQFDMKSRNNSRDKRRQGIQKYQSLPRLKLNIQPSEYLYNPIKSQFKQKTEVDQMRAINPTYLSRGVS